MAKSTLWDESTLKLLEALYKRLKCPKGECIANLSTLDAIDREIRAMKKHLSGERRHGKPIKPLRVKADVKAERRAEPR